MPTITFIILLIAGFGQAMAALDSRRGWYDMSCFTENDLDLIFPSCAEGAVELSVFCRHLKLLSILERSLVLNALWGTNTEVLEF
jgi:hypothetical protein